MEETKKEETAVEKRPASPIAMSGRGIQLTSLEEAFRFAKLVVSTGLAPRGIDTPEKALIAIQYGAELGFSPMRSLSAITVVSGKPGIYGEAALAKIREARICSIPPTLRQEGTGDELRAIVRFQRKDMPDPVEVSFSVADAKRAKLWSKTGPWQEYANDMLEWRAVARMVKRYFSDVTFGLVLVEELTDYPETRPREIAPPDGDDPLLLTAAEAEITA